MINYDGLYNKEYLGDRLGEKHFSNKKLRFRIFENATILPFKDIKGAAFFGGLIDKDNNFIEGTAVHRGVGGGAYTPNDDVQYLQLPAIYLGMLVHIWGHCLTDNLKRMWFFGSNIYRNYFKNCPILYTPMWGGVDRQFYKTS